jgi:putative oxidoreductase
VHEEQGSWTSLGLLFLRIAAGGMMLFGHGWAKLTGFMDIAPSFPDPLGLGSTTFSLGLAVFAEAFCAAAVMIGLATRIAAIPLVVTMLVAAFVVHSDDPWAKKELALLYVAPFLTLMFTGPGKFSFDAGSRWSLGR